MKVLERFILVIFSVIVIVFAVTVVLVSTEMLNTSYILDLIKNWLTNNKMIALVSGGVLALLGLIGLFSSSDGEEGAKGGLAIKSENGTVYITRDTFESIITAVTRKYVELKNVKVEMKVEETGVIANVYAMILPDTVVPTLSEKLKENIKSSVLKQTTVEIKEVNIKIKGVFQEAPKNNK